MHSTWRIPVRPDRRDLLRLYVRRRQPGWVASPVRAIAPKTTAPPATRETPIDEPYPQLVDITASTGIHFEHLSSPEQKYIVESMSGGVALIDYDGDGWPDIYFTNAQSVEMALAGKKARSALYHNNHDGTFSDVTDKAGVGYPCWAQGAAVGDYNNDGWPDLFVTCFGGVVLYRNNSDGTFTDVTGPRVCAAIRRWATGAAFGDYDGDGWPDLFVSHYVDFHLDNLAAFGSQETCRYEDSMCSAARAASKAHPTISTTTTATGHLPRSRRSAGVADPDRRYGLTSVWSDFDNDGKLDLFVTNDAGPNYLYKGDGTGTLRMRASPPASRLERGRTRQANMGVALGDYLHTGRFSCCISHFDNEYAALYRNDGAMTFSEVSFASGVGRATRGLRRMGRRVRRFRQSRLARYLPGQWPRVSPGGYAFRPAPVTGNPSCCSLTSETGHSRTSARTRGRRSRRLASAADWPSATCSTTANSRPWWRTL